MKVTNVRAYRIPTGGVRPVLVEVTTNEGITGWGEAAVAYGLGARGAAGMIADYATRVVGSDPMFPRNVYHDIYDNLVLDQRRRRHRICGGQRHRPSPLGHQGQGHGRARL